MTCRRRTRWKSSWASAEGKPVSRGGRKLHPRYLPPRRPHHATGTTQPRPSVDGCRVAPATAPVQRAGGESGIRIDGSAAGGGGGPGLCPGRQGAEDRRARLRLERRDRRRLDGAGLQPGRVARPRGGAWPASACSRRRSCCRLHPDALHRGVVLLHEPRRPGLRHDLLVGHAGDGPVRGLDGRLGDHRRRHHRHGQPGADRRPLQLPARRLAERGGLDDRRSPSSASCGSWS